MAISNPSVKWRDWGLTSSNEVYYIINKRNSRRYNRFVNVDGLRNLELDYRAAPEDNQGRREGWLCKNH